MAQLEGPTLAENQYRKRNLRSEQYAVKLFVHFLGKCVKMKETNKLFRRPFLKGVDLMRNGVKVPANRSL